MIKYYKRSEIDIEKYDTCIDQSLQSLPYAYSWYLDIVADHWDVLVYGDYEIVMPIPWRKKYMIQYIYTPLWLLQLGIFSTNSTLHESEFISEIKKRFSFTELRLNPSNEIGFLDVVSQQNEFQYLSLNTNYESIYKGYNRNRKRELKKAIDSQLVEAWNDDPQKLITLFKENIGPRVENIVEKNYDALLELMNVCIHKKLGTILSVYNEEKKLVASGFFLFHKEKMIELFCATDFANRNNGANTFLIDRAIYKHHKEYNLFDFGGSSIASIAKHYKSFGAETKQYPFLRINELPWFLKLIKS